MISHHQINLKPKSRGYHLITREVLSLLPDLPKSGIFHLFIKHTSAAITINENADPSVRVDFENIINHIVPENLPFLKHTIEGSDDMPAHIKAAIIGCSISIPIIDHHLSLGTWQGIYLCEFRNHGGARKVVVTLYQ
ncbi:MAG: secondary thiamine-phosphate synthase enzyme YjbQ [Saprospiraceae bacterium]